MGKHRFQDGDRVIGVGSTDSLEMIGRVGTVVKPSDARWEHGVLVRFDERFSDFLHNGDGRDESKQSWFCHPNDLRIFHDDLIDFTVPDLSELF